MKRFLDSVARSVAVRVSVGLIFMLLAYCAHAVFPKTMTFGDGSFPPTATRSQFCSAKFAQVNEPRFSGWSFAPGDVGCLFYKPEDDTYHGYVWTKVYTCPSGATEVGDNCGCPSGTTQTGNETSGYTCPATCAAGRQTTGQGAVGTALPTGTICVGGCTAGISSSVCNNASCALFGTQTGAECTPNTNLGTALPNGCAEGKCPGTVNGIEMCLACGSAGTNVTVTGTSTTTNSDGSTSSSTTTTQSGGPGGTNTSSNTTTNTPAPGGGPPTTTTTVSTLPAPLPGKNPQEEFCANNPDVMACKTLGTPVDGTLGAQAIGPSTITPVSVGVAGSCPADVPLPHGAAWSFAGMCLVANGVRPVVIAMAWLGAGLILIGGFRNG